MIGNNHIRLNRVNSTNKYAVEMIAKSKPIEGTVISASFQYEGRGQIGRFWESEAEKNITCSTILRPDFLEASDQFQLNIAISLALHDFISHFLDNKDVKIKWPNDIYVGDKKIAGILLQNSLIGKKVNSTIVGTGININQTEFSGDVPNPTSSPTLCLICFSICTFLCACLSCINIVRFGVSVCCVLILLGGACFGLICTMF